MNKLAIIGGSGFKDFQNKNVIFLQRHGSGVPPHEIDHKRNILKLKETGVDAIISVCSVGSLKKEIEPGTIIIPSDYINFSSVLTFFEKKAKHIMPGLDEDLKKRIIDSAKLIDLEAIDGGVYWQTAGPRFETPAEIKMISQFADIVGMTMANEATLAKEQEIPYAAICAVDNFGNGLSEDNGPETYRKNQAINKEKIERMLKSILKN